jgi:hypothetical protein
VRSIVAVGFVVCWFVSCCVSFCIGDGCLGYPDR